MTNAIVTTATRLTSHAAGIVALGCAAILVGRRLSGGLPRGAGPVGLVAVAAVGFALVMAADAATRRGAPLRRRARPPAGGRGPGHPLPRTWPSLAARGALLCSVAALVPPWPFTWLSWGAVATAVAAFVATALPFGGRNPEGGAASRRASRGAASAPPPTPPSLPDRSPRPRPGAEAPGAGGRDERGTDTAVVTQRLTRFHDPRAGSDRVEGELVIVIPPGERSAPGHLAFCPPFTAIPHVAVEVADAEAEAEAAAVEVLPWGARIECRLEQATEEPIGIRVSFRADSTADGAGRPASRPHDARRR